MIKFRDRIKGFLNPNTRATDNTLEMPFSTFIGTSDSGIIINEETALKQINN